MSKQLPIRVNTSRNHVTDYLNRAYKKNFQQQIGQSLFAVNGDVITVVADFNFEDTDGTVKDLSLAGALSLRCTIANKRSAPTVVYSVQDAYNAGIVPSNESLPAGLVTWSVFLDPANIDPILLAEESIGAWLDVSWIDSDGLPQTLVQVPMQIFQQIDSDLVGSPPPSSPTYNTAAELLLLYVQKFNYIGPEILVAGSIPDFDGLINFHVDTTAGDVNVTLDAIAGYSARFSPIITNLGTNKVIVTLTGGETINGDAGPVEIVGQYGTLSLYVDAVNGEFLAPVMVVP